MSKKAIGAVTALFIVGASMAHAQGAAGAAVPDENGRLNQTEFKILTDTRVGMVKVALQLTPEQQQYWPAIEDAIRARSEARFRRLSTLDQRLGQWREANPVQLYRARADALAERSANLKRLADAWQPLYQTLTPDQKMRLRLVTVRALESIRNAADDRRMDMFDEEDFDY
jgi:hypothetical protein